MAFGRDVLFGLVVIFSCALSPDRTNLMNLTSDETDATLIHLR